MRHGGGMTLKNGYESTIRHRTLCPRPALQRTAFSEKLMDRKIFDNPITCMHKFVTHVNNRRLNQMSPDQMRVGQMIRSTRIRSLRTNITFAAG